MTRAQKSRLRCRFHTTFNPSLKVVALQDHDAGMSITNDAENVIEWLFEQNLLREDEHVVYRDTDGVWDELLHKDGKFIGFRLLRALNMTHAAIRATAKDDAPFGVTGDWRQ